jgi:hypothetical protein
VALRRAQKIRQGDRAYFYKQGKQPRGIFGVGVVVGPAAFNKDAEPGENPWSVPITFEQLVDPIEKLLLTESEILSFGVPEIPVIVQAVLRFWYEEDYLRYSAG